MTSIDSSISDNIITTVIDVYNLKIRANNWALRKTSINWIFLQRPPIQIHLKTFITSSTLI